MTLFPEIEDALVQSARTRRARARAWVGGHPRRTAAVVAVTLSLAGSATAAGLLTEHKTIADGPTEQRVGADGVVVTATYRVQANVIADRVCLSIDISKADSPGGKPSTCAPQPITTPLSQVTLDLISQDKTRLLTGVVRQDVASVQATGTDQPVQLNDIAGVPGRFFTVKVSAPGPITLLARNAAGEELANFDSSTMGPVGRG